MANSISLTLFGNVRLGILSALLFTAASCGNGNISAYLGDWKGNRNLKANPNVEKKVLDQVSQFKLSIQPDGTFTAEDAGLPESGSWQVVKDHAEFSVQKVMGQPVDGANNKPLITVTPQPDGTLLWKDPAGFDPDGLTLHKSQQPLTPVPTG